jgi:hypothetical protein
MAPFKARVESTPMTSIIAHGLFRTR